MKKSVFIFFALFSSYYAIAQSNTIKVGYAHLWQNYTIPGYPEYPFSYAMPENDFSFLYGYKISPRLVAEGGLFIGKATSISTVYYDTVIFATKNAVVNFIPNIGLTYYLSNYSKGFYISLYVPFSIVWVKREQYDNKGYYNTNLDGWVFDTFGLGLGVKVGYSIVIKKKFLIDPYCSFLTEDITSFGFYNRFIAGISTGVLFK